MQEHFTNIYQTQFWTNKDSDPNTYSGPGSSLLYTENLVKELPNIIKELNIYTILDAACGDFNWMPLVLAQLNNYKYHGADIVEPLINDLKTKFPEHTWSQLDITKDPLPIADLMICRDCLMHLSFEDINHFFDNFLKSNIKYLLLTSHTYADNNIITSGDYRQLNLFNNPVNLEQNYLYNISDWIPGHAERYMYLWTREAIMSSRRPKIKPSINHWLIT